MAEPSALVPLRSDLALELRMVGVPFCVRSRLALGGSVRVECTLPEGMRSILLVVVVVLGACSPLRAPSVCCSRIAMLSARCNAWYPRESDLPAGRPSSSHRTLHFIILCVCVCVRARYLEYLNMTPAPMRKTTSQPMVTAKPRSTPGSVMPQPRERMCLRDSVGSVWG